MSLVKTLKRRWYLIPVAIVALLLVAVVLLFAFLGHLAKAGVATVLPKITGTPAAMGHFGLNPLTGNLVVRDFTIGNPEGYREEHAFRLGELKVTVDVASLFSERIVIREILVDGLQVSYETKLTESNISRIKRNVEAFSQKEQKEEAARPAEGAEEASGKPVKKVQIDDLRLQHGTVAFHAGMAGLGAGSRLPLPDIHLTGIGKEPDGATTGEVAEEIFTALYQAIMRAVANAGNIRTDDLKAVGDGVKEGADSLIKGVKDLF
jgi:hypothetical protein